MKNRSRNLLFVAAVGALFQAGCAEVPKTAGKSHVIYLPPETGSHLPKAIRVDDAGDPIAGASGSNIGTTNADSLRRVNDTSAYRAGTR